MLCHAQDDYSDCSDLAAVAFSGLRQDGRCGSHALSLAFLGLCLAFLPPVVPAQEVEFLPTRAAVDITEPAASEDDSASPDSAAAESAPEPAPAEEEIEEIEEIVVTGSRIRRDNFSSALPITVISRDQSELEGVSNVSDALQSGALASGSQVDNAFGGVVVSGGPGVNTFGLRSLDPDHTLVLLNGRRYTPAGLRGEVNSVDLNSIPFVAIQSIEILKDGASSVYGADAVAGVVNIITRKNFDDFVVEGSWQDEIKSGNLSALYGKNWDRGHFDIAVSYSRLGEVVRGERGWASCDQRPLTNGEVGFSSYAPTSGDCFGVPFGYVELRETNETTEDYVMDPAADLSGTGLNWRRASRSNIGLFIVPELDHRDLRNAAVQHLIPQRELFQLYSNGAWDFELNNLNWGASGKRLGTVRIGYEFYYNRRSDRINIGYGQFFPEVAGSNPTNPFSALDRGVASARPVIMTYNLRDPFYEIENDVMGLHLDLSGELGAWQWQLFGGYSLSRGELDYSTLLKDKVARALSSVRDPTGRLFCTLRDMTQLEVAAGADAVTIVPRILAEGIDPDCVPLDLFTEDALRRGIVPASAADYISERVTEKTDYDLFTTSFNTEGRLFDMPSGEARIALGLEWRRRKLDDRPPLSAQQNNQWGFTAAGRTEGRDAVWELYGELELPLLAGQLALVEELTLNASLRRTDYDSYGSDTTWRILMSYAVTPVLRFRSSLGTSFRAPALYQLYLNNQSAFVSANADPCSNYDAGDRNSNRYQNCAALQAQGILPANYVSDRSLEVLSGGNRDLKAESADTLTAGVILTPDVASVLPRLGINLNLAIDYYDIDLQDSITRLSSLDILNRCYGSPGLSSQECALVGARLPDGRISRVNTSFINVAEERSRGYDITLRVDREFASGDLSVNLLAARLLSYRRGIMGESEQFRGLHAFPEWRGESSVSFSRRNYTLSWSATYIGATEEAPRVETDDGSTNVRRARERLYHTLALRYTEPRQRYAFTVGVRNLTDEKPPVVGWGSSSPARGTSVRFNIPAGAGYDYSGVRLFLAFTYNFF